MLILISNIGVAYIFFGYHWLFTSEQQLNILRTKHPSLALIYRPHIDLRQHFLSSYRRWTRVRLVVLFVWLLLVFLVGASAFVWMNGAGSAIAQFVLLSTVITVLIIGGDDLLYHLRKGQ